jgi:hypothetical protein
MVAEMVCVFPSGTSEVYWRYVSPSPMRLSTPGSGEVRTRGCERVPVVCSADISSTLKETLAEAELPAIIAPAKPTIIAAAIMSTAAIFALRKSVFEAFPDN